MFQPRVFFNQAEIQREERNHAIGSLSYGEKLPILHTCKICRDFLIRSWHHCFKPSKILPLKYIYLWTAQMESLTVFPPYSLLLKLT